MKVIKTEIRHYTITEPVKICYSDSFLTVLIGKNGSKKIHLWEVVDVIREATRFNGFGGPGHRLTTAYT